MRTLRGYGVGRLVALLGVGIGVAAVLAALVFNLGGQPKALLYSNLDLKEASEVTQALSQAGIKFEAVGDGSTIMVPRDKVASTRLMIAGKGLVSSGSVGYELFDSGSALGQTDFVQQLNRQRALEGELARTIRSLDGVTFARVHLVMPKRQLFEEDAESPAASVTIGIGGRKPSADQVQAVQNLVAGAVPNLKAEQVTVIDQHGKTLSTGGSDASVAGRQADDRRAEIEKTLSARIKDMVEGVVGAGKARVEVSADIDMEQVTESKKAFDPDGQVVRSEQTSEETSAESDPNSAAGVTASANIPTGAATAPGSITLPSSKSTAGANTSTTNYEIGETTTNTITLPGAVKKLSVAVAVDGITPIGKGGKPGAYAPRSAADMKKIEDLVRAAAGFDASRGDTVTVVNVRFPSAEDGEGVTASSALLGFDKNDIMRAIELGILGIVGILLILFGVRPMLKRATGGGGFLPAPMSSPAGGSQLLAQQAGGAPQARIVTMPDGSQVAVDASGQALSLPGPDLEQRIDIARIEGQVKASSVKQVSDFVDRHPDESVSILRSWLHETT
ncbi:flagellar M-ring protein FliF [Caulobacter ginsengisoli]|uniref:Flagellar M-ring protein n=1 Tax=Caulobacter ginsengisoli TaxID=400775 RepID=A0ABU0IXR9_9CAUL|nr:flagellar basal-body MS-ring/collar protein FliF [Caulobacter ginsengisoli]MDQ0466170.1 flagellar M-ring protein FliF [Caulobacter ginsengisoli]